MKSHVDLSKTGKLRRLRDLAAAALSHFDLKCQEIAYTGFSTEAVFEHDEQTGQVVRPPA